MRKGISLLIFTLLLGSILWCGKGMGQAQASTLPNDLKFLGYCDEKEFAVWDQQIAKMDEEQAAAMKSYIENQITKGALNDYEEAMLIYNWIFENVTYASDVSVPAYLEPYDVFTHKTAVCGGYSNLYKAMLNLMDIPSVLISGMTPYGGHVWNAVYANGMWFYSDATWGGDYFHKAPNDFLQDHYSQRIEFVQAETSDGLLVGYDNGIAVVGVANKMITVTVPDTFYDLPITSVSHQLFAQQYGVKVLNVGKSVTEISEVFCETLEAIHVDESNSVYASKDGVLFSKDLSRIRIYPMAKKETSFTLPKETTVIDLKESIMNPYLVNLEVEEGNTEYSSYKGALYNVDRTELLMVPLGKTKVYVPDEAKVGEFAFTNADTSKITIYADKGTPAHQYALEKGIAFADGEAVTDLFGDVEAGKWYVPYIQYVYDNGLMFGSNGLFKPEGEKGWVLRQQFVEILWRMENKPAPKSHQALKNLVDVPENAYYKDSLCWAYENGIITGVGGKYFAGGEKLTRQQLAAIMYRYAEKMGYDTSKTADYSAMPGADKVAEYAQKAVGWAVGSGIISGSGADKALNPTDGATRAQLAAILQRFCEK